MNFLAHYLLAEHRNSPQFHLGSLYPDFGRRAGIPLHEQRIAGNASEIYPELTAGMQLHWYADRQFHQSALFTDGCRLWKSMTGHEIASTRRKFFLYHLLFEMWLDRLLLTAQPESALAMYQSIERVEPDPLRRFSEEIAGDPDGRLLHTLQDFSDRKFILNYRDDEKFAGIAAGVFAYATQQEKDPRLQMYLQQKLPEMMEFGNEYLNKWQTFRDGILESWEFPV